MPLPLAFGSLILGGIQAGVSAWQLNQLNKTPTPMSSISPEMQNSYGRAESRAAYGYSPEQRSDYFNNVAGRYSQGVLNANKMGGGQIGGAVGRAFQSSSLDDFSQFAANDAQLQQQNIRYADSRGDVISNQRDQIIGQQRQDRQMKEQAFGGALSSGLNNIAGAANFFGMNGGFDGLFKGNNNTNTAAPGTTGGYGQEGGGWGRDANGHWGINNNPPGAGQSSAPAGGWQMQNQTGMNSGGMLPGQSDFTPDGLPINQLGVPFNNTGKSPYGRYSPWEGVNSTQSAPINGFGYGENDPFANSINIPVPSYSEIEARQRLEKSGYFKNIYRM